MFILTIPKAEFYDSEKEEFINSKPKTLQLEHSLVSISKWESKWNKPFLVKGEKTIEETLHYVKCMTMNPNVDDSTYSLISNDMLREIKEYIDSEMTATTYKKQNDGKTNNEIITSELIYYWMVSYNIPFDCQKWHLNRLLTLINVCNVKNAPPKKVNKGKIMSENKRINEDRKAKMNSAG